MNDSIHVWPTGVVFLWFNMYENGCTKITRETALFLLDIYNLKREHKDPHKECLIITEGKN